MKITFHLYITSKCTIHTHEKKTKTKIHLLRSINPDFQTGYFMVKRGRNIDSSDLMYFIKHLFKG